MKRPLQEDSFIVRYNYVVFLAALLLILLGGSASMVFYTSGVPRIIDALAVIVFMFGVWTLPKSRIFYLAGLLLLIGAILLNAVGVMLDQNSMRYVMLVLLTLFLILTMYTATNHILLSDEIDLNCLFGATCIYILLGLIFGNIYFLVFVAAPDAFTGVSDNSFSGQLVEMTYHSFVTLTTLGYGDINPVQPLARTLCYLEAVIGQMYLTILVAALVGIHIASRYNKKKKNL